MTRLIVGGTVFAGTLFGAAFLIVLAADRRLGVPAPYSIMIAPVLLSSVAAMLLLSLDWWRPRTAVQPALLTRQLSTQPLLRDAAAGTTRSPRRVEVAEGFVLIHTASERAAEEQAA